VRLQPRTHVLHFSLTNPSSNAAAVSTACFAGQYAFGLLTSTIFGLACTLTHVPSLRTVGISVGAAIGVFSSSSGGGNPCEYTSGGGLGGFAGIVVAGLVGVVASSMVYGGGSIVPPASAAAGACCVMAGIAGKAAVYVWERESGKRDEEEGVSLRGGVVYGERMGRRQVMDEILRAAKDELMNPEIVVRVGIIVAICGGLHLVYSIEDFD